jgi:hypothetical protein
VGEFANSDSTVVDENIQDNTQLGIAAAVFVLFVVFCVMRVFVAKLFGWKLQGVPTGEEEWDSDEPSDEEFDEEEDFDFDDDDDDDDDYLDGDLSGTKLKRKKSRRKSRKSSRKSMLPTFASEVKKRASVWLGGADSGGGRSARSGSTNQYSLEMIDVTANPVASRSGVPISPTGRAGVSTTKRVNVRKSVAHAATMQQLASVSHSSSALTGEVAGGAAGEVAGGARSGSQQYRFIAEEWRRHKDSHGYTFFHHIPSDVTTYAMPWVLTAEDLAKPIHDANSPTNWRAVETGRKRKDGTPITMYYNTVTKQSTFDLPMFAVW